MGAVAIRLQRVLPPQWAGVAAGLSIAMGTAVAVDPGIALALAAAAIAPVLIWADPRWSVGLFAVGLACNIDVVRDPVHISLPQLLALAMVAALTVRSIPSEPAARRWARTGSLFALAASPSLVRAVSPVGALQGMIELTVLAMVLAACVRWLTSRPDVARSALELLVIGAALSVVPAVVQVVFDIGPATFRSNGVMRAYSTFRQPNSWGLYLAGVFPVALGIAAARRSARWACTVAIIALGLVLSGSRGAWVGAAFGCVALVAAVFRLRARTLAALGFGAMALLLLIWLMPRELIAARLDFTDWSTGQRLLVLLTTWDGILRNPVLGWGPGSFEHMLPAIARQGLVDDVAMPHNLVLEIWFQLGLLALISFLALVTACLVSAFRVARRVHDVQLAGLLAGVVGMLVAAQFGTLFIRGVQESFVLLIALIAAHVLAHTTPSRTDDAHSLPV